MNREEKIIELEDKIDRLKKAVHSVQWRIDELEREIKYLKTEISHEIFTKKSTTEAEKISEPISSTTSEELDEEKAELLENLFSFASEKEAQSANEPADASTLPKINLEEWIGGNLLGKLGILILLIGLGYFVKYAIDHDLISPLGRVLLAYMAGASLVGVAKYLKVNYPSFSAVLLGGGIATAYFTTYFAFILWELMPQWVAFGLMFCLTLYAVWEATQLDEEMIGIIGLVAAYCIPIMLGKQGGNVAVMFGYMAIINAGVLRLAFFKNWNRMNLTAFVATWLIFLLWFWSSYSLKDYGTVLAFDSIFFGMFYFILIAYHLSEKKILQEFILVAVFLNSLIFYGIGWAVIVELVGLDRFFTAKYEHPYLNLTLFTLFNAFLQGLIGFVLWKKSAIDKQLKYLSVGWAITFLTLSVVVFFEGEWIMALWTLESILLFAVSRKEKIKFFEYISYTLSILSIASVPFCWEANWWSLIWFVETLALIAVFIRFENKFLEGLCYILSIATAMSIPYYYGSEWTLYGLMIELLVLYGLGKFYQIELLQHISQGILGFVWIALIGFWNTYYFVLNENAILFWNPVFRTTMLISLGILLLIGLYFRLPISKQAQPQHHFRGFDFQQIFKINFGDMVIISLILTLYIGIALDLSYLFSIPIPISNTQANEKIFFEWRFLTNSFVGLVVLIFSGAYLTLLTAVVWRVYPKFPYLELIFGSSLLFTLIFAFVHYYDVNTIVWSAKALQNTPHYTSFYVLCRFVAYTFGIGIVVMNFYGVRALNLQKAVRFKRYVIWLNIFVLWIMSGELQYFWLLNSNLPPEQALSLTSKLGFTVLWAIYAVGMISYGIRYKRKYLRMAGFWIIGITLLKLFGADLSYNSPLQVMIAFVSVGLLLLTTAFLYQKYKDLILAEDE